jgi:hypothetical protein
MIQAYNSKGITPNKQCDKMLIRWWPSIVHGKAASISNIQSILIIIMYYTMHMCTHLKSVKNFFFIECMIS